MSDPCLSSQPTQSHHTSTPMSFVVVVVGGCLYGGQSGHGRCQWEWSFLDTGQKWGVVEGTGLPCSHQTLLPSPQPPAPARKLAAEAQTSIAAEILPESAALDLVTQVWSAHGQWPPRADCACRASIPPRACQSEPDCKETPRDACER